MELTEVNEENAVEQDTALKKAEKRRNPFRVQQEKEERDRRQKKRARLIVRNISYKIKEEDLRKHFEQWGQLEDVNLLKRSDGKLVGCAFVQYENVNQATKAILKGNGKELLGRSIFIDWAVGKDEFVAKKEGVKEEPVEKKPKMEVKNEEEIKSKEEDDDGGDDDDGKDGTDENDDSGNEEDATSDNDEADDDEADDDDADDDEADDDDGDDDEAESQSENEDEDKKDIKSKTNITKEKKEKHISNDVQEGCTIFIKNVPFDAEDQDLRKICRKFGPVYYTIINREPISGHSKGTAFVKYKTKESADLCLQASEEFVLMDQVLEPFPALSREEMRQQNEEKSKKETKDSRNLYLAREGLIMANSKAAEGVSASDMNKRHKLEQIKTQVLKNLNRFVSRNRLSVHNLPLNYDNDNLKDMVIAYTGFKPHECRVMRENKITPEHPKGKSKGFGFMSFNTHQEALTALRKLNNNPKIFGNQHRPIVAFSIEDRAVHKVKEKREERSKINNPTYKDKLKKRKALKQQKKSGKLPLKRFPSGPQSDDKEKLKKHIKNLEESRAKRKNQNNKTDTMEIADNYVGTEAKEGTVLRMRSFKKIKEQSKEHMQRVKQEKKKKKQQKIKQTHLAERKAVIRPKQGRKLERDDLAPLVNKYKKMLDKHANDGGSGPKKLDKKPKRTKWYTE